MFTRSIKDNQNNLNKVTYNMMIYLFTPKGSKQIINSLTIHVCPYICTYSYYAKLFRKLLYTNLPYICTLDYVFITVTAFSCVMKISDIST